MLTFLADPAADCSILHSQLFGAIKDIHAATLPSASIKSENKTSTKSGGETCSENIKQEMEVTATVQPEIEMSNASIPSTSFDLAAVAFDPPLLFADNPPPQIVSVTRKRSSLATSTTTNPELVYLPTEAEMILDPSSGLWSSSAATSITEYGVPATASVDASSYSPFSEFIEGKASEANVICLPRGTPVGLAGAYPEPVGAIPGVNGAEKVSSKPKSKGN